MRFWSEKDIEREPVGWFHFEEAFKFNTLPEIFVQFIQLHLKKTICCKESISQIIIIFENEEDEHQDIDPEISNWLETVCDMKPEEGELNKIYFQRLWREYKKQTGHCFSCGELLDHNGPCYYCKIDFIILEEMTHFGNAWNNWGNSTFISNSMPTITSRGEIDTKFRSEIYRQCIAIGESMDFMPLPANQCNTNRTTGKITEPLIRTWNNLTTPLHYGAAARIQECKNRRTKTIPLLEELCLKNVFSILVENHKLTQHGIKQLPLLPMMISKMKRIFSTGESLVYAPNRTHEYGLRIHLQMTGKHALGDCKLQ